MPIEWLPGALERLTGVEPYEVSQVLNGAPLHAIPIERHGARLLLVMGRTQAGRVIVVLIRPGTDFDSKIIAARPAADSEISAHETWEVNR